ncbi:MAG: glycosyltransferase family 39 protein [Microgenomates group bacterium]
MTILLFISAFLIRLINLNQSLWLDESIVAKVVKTIPFHLIPTQLSPGDVHPPFYYMAVSAWTSLFGYSEVVLRMPSILFSLIAGWFVYKIGRLLKNHTTGLWAAAFFLFNPLIIYYSQEARMHMMAAMFLTIALYYFLSAIQPKPSKNDKTLFNVFAGFSMFTFYGSGFFIAAILIIYWFVIPMKIGIQKGNNKKSKLDWISTFVEMTKMMFSMTWGLLFSLLILSPLLYSQMLNAKAGLADLKNWSMALGKAELKNVAMIFLKFATGRLSWYPKISYYLVSGIPTALIWLAALFGVRKNKLFGYLFILPLLFGLFVSFWAPMMMYFRFLYLVPVMSILLAQSVIPMKIGIQKGLLNRFRIEYGMTALFLLFSLIYLLLPQFHREDWKELGRHLNENIPVYMILPSSDPVGYYRSDVRVFELRDIKKAVVPETIYVIPYTNEIYGLDHSQLLKEKGCMKESEQHFRGDLILEKWICLRNA